MYQSKTKKFYYIRYFGATCFDSVWVIFMPYKVQIKDDLERVETFCPRIAYTSYTQRNVAVSKVNKKFISHLKRAQPTPSAAATVQVSQALITVLQCVHPGSHDTHTHTHTHTLTHRKPFPAATPSWKPAPRPRSKHEKRTASSAWETWTVAAADGVGCAHVRWEMNFLWTFETSPFFCV